LQHQVESGVQNLKDLQGIARHVMHDAKGALLKRYDSGLQRLRCDSKERTTSDSHSPSIGGTPTSDSSLESYIDAEDVGRVNQQPLLDPTHQFNAQQIAKHLAGRSPRKCDLGRRTRAAELVRFTLMRRMGAAIVRCVERDISELKRLNGQVYVALDNRQGTKWWTEAIGMPLSETPAGCWKIAAAWAQQDLESRGFVVDSLIAKLSETALQVKWRLNVP
jgi:hypothetical protein